MQNFHCYAIQLAAERLPLVQGVYYRTDTSEIAALECPTSEDLARALTRYPVYRFRVLAVDGVVWDIELSGDSEWVYVGYSDGSEEYLEQEGDE